MIGKYEIENVGFDSYYDPFNQMINNVLLASSHNVSSNFALLKEQLCSFLPHLTLMSKCFCSQYMIFHGDCERCFVGLDQDR